jgi:hypothetical protein
MKGKRGAPVLGDENDLVEIERVDEGMEVADVIDKPVLDIRLAGLAIADQIRRDARAVGATCGMMLRQM